MALAMAEQMWTILPSSSHTLEHKHLLTGAQGCVQVPVRERGGLRRV
jgi:hypothetical protein